MNREPVDRPARVAHARTREVSGTDKPVERRGGLMPPVARMSAERGHSRERRDAAGPIPVGCGTWS